MGHALHYLKEELVEIETNGLLLQPRTLDGPTGARATFDGREVVNLASNNYLGLANHPRMNRAAADAAWLCEPPSRQKRGHSERGARKADADECPCRLPPLNANCTPRS